MDSLTTRLDSNSTFLFPTPKFDLDALDLLADLFPAGGDDDDAAAAAAAPGTGDLEPTLVVPGSPLLLPPACSPAGSSATMDAEQQHFDLDSIDLDDMLCDVAAVPDPLACLQLKVENDLPSSDGEAALLPAPPAAPPAPAPRPRNRKGAKRIASRFGWDESVLQLDKEAFGAWVEDKRPFLSRDELGDLRKARRRAQNRKYQNKSRARKRTPARGSSKQVQVQVPTEAHPAMTVVSRGAGPGVGVALEARVGELADKVSSLSRLLARYRACVPEHMRPEEDTPACW